MFYPHALPIPAEGLSPLQAMEIETAVMVTVLRGDRDLHRRESPAELVRGYVDELCFYGLAGDPNLPEVSALLEANAEPLYQFIQTRLPPVPSDEDLRWLAPDLELLERLAGPTAAAAWRERLARERAAPVPDSPAAATR